MTFTEHEFARLVALGELKSVVADLSDAHSLLNAIGDPRAGRLLDALRLASGVERSLSRQSGDECENEPT